MTRRRETCRPSPAPSATGTPAWAPMAGCWWRRPPMREAEGAIQLYNSDGSTAEISGNGTRCAAAFLIRHGYAAGVVRDSHRRRHQDAAAAERAAGSQFEFEMNMGRPEITRRRFALPLSTGPRDVTLLWVGNPQCAVPVERFRFRLARHGRGDRAAPPFPQSHQRFLHRARWTAIASMCASTSGERARP